MNERVGILAIAVFAVAACTVAVPASAIRIEGLSPLQPLAAQPAAVSVVDHVLRVDMEAAAPLTVSPWPANLPQRFGPQLASGFRSLNPAGPIDRVELRHPSESQPWLLVVAGARQGQPVVGDWTLDLEDGRWLLRGGGTQLHLDESGKPAQVYAEDAPWCVHLLNATEPTPASRETVQESEPQVSVVAVRKSGSVCQVR